MAEEMGELTLDRASRCTPNGTVLWTVLMFVHVLGSALLACYIHRSLQVNPVSTPPTALPKLPEEEGEEQHGTIPSPSFSPSSSPLQHHTEAEVILEDEKKAGVEPNSQQSLSQQEVLEAAIVASESARQVWKQLDGKSREWLPTYDQGCVSVPSTLVMTLTDSATNDGNSIGVTTPHKKNPGEESKTTSTSGNFIGVTTPHKKEPGEESKTTSTSGNSIGVTTPHKKELGEERKASNDDNSIGVITPHKKEPGEERKATSTSVGGEQPPHTDSHSSSPHPASPQPLPPADVQVS